MSSNFSQYFTVRLSSGFYPCIKPWRHSFRWFVLPIIALLCSFQTALAVEVDNLFLVKRPVSDQSIAIRQQATLDGFKEMLVRKSGSEIVLQAFEVQQALPKATAFLQRFEYQKNEVTRNSDTRTTTKGESETELPYTLLLHFDPVLIDNLIRSAGTSVWGVNRPLTLFWLAVEDENGRHLLSDDVDVFADVATVKKEAERRAIPVMLPLLDLDDQMNIQFSDVWGRFSQPINDASARYGADIVVAGQIYPTGQIWRANLVLLNGDKELPISFETTERAQIYATMVNRVTEQLCLQYCVNEVEGETQLPAKIVVGGVTGFRSYKKVEQALSELSSIRNVTTDSVFRSYLTLSLRLLGDVDDVKKALAINNHFRVMEAEEIKKISQRDKIETEIIEEAPALVQNSEIAASENNELAITTSKVATEPPTGPEQDQTQSSELTEQNNKQKPEEQTLYYRWIE